MNTSSRSVHKSPVNGTNTASNIKESIEHDAFLVDSVVLPPAVHALLEQPMRRSLSPAETGSALTGSGCPLELSFSTADDRDRYTLDPFLYSRPPAQRLGATLELMTQRFGADVCATTRQWITSMQPQQSNYGAWLGLRCPQHDAPMRFDSKLYFEVDPGIEQVYWPFLSGPSSWGQELTMIGLTPQTSTHREQFELYFRCRRLNKHAFTSILEPLSGVASSHRLGIDLQSALERIYARPLRDRLPGGMAGISYALTDDEQVTSVTLFLYARSVFGRDRRIRRRFAHLLAASGKSPRRYLQITSPSVSNVSALTQHGMFAITINAHGKLVYSIGYCPRGAQQHAH